MPTTVTANPATAADGPSAPATTPAPVGRGVPGVPAGVVAWTTHPTTSTEPAKASRCCHRRNMTRVAQAASRKNAQGPDRAEQAHRPDQRRQARGMGRLKKLPGSVVDL